MIISRPRAARPRGGVRPFLFVEISGFLFTQLHIALTSGTALIGPLGTGIHFRLGRSPGTLASPWMRDSWES